MKLTGTDVEVLYDPDGDRARVTGKAMSDPMGLKYR
jgi:hypothetical protein